MNRPQFKEFKIFVLISTLLISTLAVIFTLLGSLLSEKLGHSVNWLFYGLILICLVIAQKVYQVHSSKKVSYGNQLLLGVLISIGVSLALTLFALIQSSESFKISTLINFILLPILFTAPLLLTSLFFRKALQ